MLLNVNILTADGGRGGVTVKALEKHLFLLIILFLAAAVHLLLPFHETRRILYSFRLRRCCLFTRRSSHVHFHILDSLFAKLRIKTLMESSHFEHP